MDRKEILETTEKMVNGSRKDDYGKPEDSFSLIAELWSAYIKYRQRITGVSIDMPYSFRRDDAKRQVNIIRGNLEPKDVAAMMILLKIARIAGGHGKSDNWIDIAGYAACGGEAEGKGNPSRTVMVPGESWTAKAAVGMGEGEATPEKNIDWNALADEIHKRVDAIAEMVRKVGEL